MQITINCGFGNGSDHYSDKDDHNDSDDSYVDVKKYNDHENCNNKSP